jgi:predicted nucleic acid-binding protein
MIYLDSNVFLYASGLSQANSKLAAQSVGVLKAMANGELDAATSALTWDEVFWNTKKRFGREVAAKESMKFLGLANLKILKVSEATIRNAQEMTVRYGLDPRDAIHAAACIENGITEIISDDPDFDRIGVLKRVAPTSFRSPKA